MKLYHFTKKENVNEILENGLIAKSNYLHLGCNIRKDAIYAWLAPEHEVMGYSSNSDYTLLELDVDAENLLVVNMDYISSAYVNYMRNERLANAIVNEMIDTYQKSAVSIENYSSGHFRAPEVIITSYVQSKKIKVVDSTIRENRNLLDYKKANRLYYLFEIGFISISEIEDIKLKLIAIHDDSTGMLATFKTDETSQFYTFNIAGELKDALMQTFFNANDFT